MPDKLDSEMIRIELDSLYEKGATPDILYVSLESAYRRGLISYWEYSWRKVLQKLRRFLGI